MEQKIDQAKLANPTALVSVKHIDDGHFPKLTNIVEILKQAAERWYIESIDSGTIFDM